MSKQRSHSGLYAKLAVAGVILIACVVGIQVYRQSSEPSTPAPVVAKSYSHLDFDDPKASYQILRYTVETGGDARTRELSIEWLDKRALLQQPLKPEQQEWLLSMLSSNGHPSWDSGYRLWIFNSAFNNLQVDSDPNKFNHLLQKLALESPEKSMRLYALQHIGLQREAGRITGALAKELHATHYTLANESDGQVAGTALTTLFEWDLPKSSNDPKLISLALKLANDPERPVDIRVTALHAADGAALALSRALAVDSTQPVLVRKAAIASIGRHGGQDDSTSLESLAGENFRIAQAAEPALRAIQKRLSNTHNTQPIPF